MGVERGFSTQQNHCSMLLKVTWRREELKIFNTVEPATYRTRGAFLLVGNWRVRDTRGTGEWNDNHAERECDFG
jgi:hypothetical protein